ncbi:hypothetical protein NBE98_08495 [Clostridium swellfunianum]|uniref:hypothetical protein n=1 Tax=Clostridium swellfunianum TaxID=1367462 RepID=UPI00202FA79E|nr:hypothetical protein [Clostridium swellfunianum]MCM0648411.1 hypothetical protein [Clostridium swellfunianum]
MKRIVIVLIACILVIALVGCGGHEGEAKTPSGSSVQKGRSYQEVVNDFKGKGFKNIKTEKLEDLITGWLTKDGEVDSVSVSGDKGYSPDVWYSNDVEVVITYHTFPSKDKKPESPASSPTEQKAPQQDKHDEAVKAALETTFPVENAKRAAVVAITNSYAADVFKADGNTYDVSKFHSYADTSGNVKSYFFNVTSWGTWSVKDEKTWHVDSLMLKNILGTIANGSLDVKYDGSKYIVSNVKGTFGKDGDLSEIEAGSSASLCLMIPTELIKNNRSQTEVDALDRSKDLDKHVARSAFENHGKSVYPYGFECHWIVDLRNEEQTPEGSWIFKVGVTITNQNGTKKDAITEGIISGNTNNPIVKEFNVH